MKCNKRITSLLAIVAISMIAFLIVLPESLQAKPPNEKGKQ